MLTLGHLVGRISFKVIFLLNLVIFFAGSVESQPSSVPLRFLETIPLPYVEGRIDHLAIDREEQRLFIAALGNNSVEVVDLHQRARIKSIRGLSEPQGIFYDAEHRKIYVSNSRDGSLRIYDAVTFRYTGAVSFSGDADNLRFEEQTKYLYVGYGDGALAIVDTRTDKQVGDVKLAGHPEGFSLDKSSRRIFINVPTGKRITVVDRSKQKKVADWPVACAENFPMALDEAQHRLFIGCRHPSKVIVFDTETGRQTTAVAIPRDVDDLFYDTSLKRLYVSCGAGSVIVFAQENPDKYHRIAIVKTRTSGRTSLFDRELQRFYIAVPRSGSTPAGIMVYEAGQ